jgi:hypothetical protein
VQDAEVLVLKSSRTSVFEGGKRLAYEETSETERRRLQIQQINQWLADADIDVEPDANDPDPDIHNRQLRRIFNNGSWFEGGRLIGGFWQGMKKRERSGRLSIQGEPVVTLDYHAMNARLLYATAGSALPMDDPYELNIPGCTRGTIKQLFNAMAYAEKRFVRWPKNLGDSDSRPRVWHATGVVEAAHPLIAPLFWTGTGLRMMYLESEILIDTLLRLRTAGVIALPIHDAVIVRASAQSIAKEAMLSAFKDRTGFDTQVKLEGTN